jgi:hypothetical protein
MKPRIYISGPITLRDTYEQAEKEFAQGSEEVRELFSKFSDIEIIDPCERGIVKNWTWLDYMIEDLWCLKRCTHIYMLRDWEQSPGAKIEHAIAVRTEMEIIYQ